MGWKSRVAKQTKNIRTIAHWEKKAQTQKRIVLFQTQNLSHGLQLCAATTEQHCCRDIFWGKELPTTSNYSDDDGAETSSCNFKWTWWKG